MFICQLLGKQPQDLSQAEIKTLLSTKQQYLFQLLRHVYQSALSTSSTTLLAACLKLYIEQVRFEADLLEGHFDKKRTADVDIEKQIKSMTFEELQAEVDKLLNEA